MHGTLVMWMTGNAVATGAELGFHALYGQGMTACADVLSRLAGKGQPDAQGFVRIAETEDVSLAWLMGDTRKIGSLTPDEVMLLQKIRGLTDVHKEDIRAFVEHYYAQDNKTKEERPFRAEKRATY